MQGHQGRHQVYAAMNGFGNNADRAYRQPYAQFRRNPASVGNNTGPGGPFPPGGILIRGRVADRGNRLQGQIAQFLVTYLMYNWPILA